MAGLAYLPSLSLAGGNIRLSMSESGETEHNCQGQYPGFLHVFSSSKLKKSASSENEPGYVTKIYFPCGIGTYRVFARRFPAPHPCGANAKICSRQIFQ